LTNPNAYQNLQDTKNKGGKRRDPSHPREKHPLTPSALEPRTFTVTPPIVIDLFMERQAFSASSTFMTFTPILGEFIARITKGQFLLAWRLQGKTCRELRTAAGQDA
jgi:hypothetical protein